MIAFITGSGFYDMDGFQQETVETRFGTVALLRGTASGNPCIILPRHGAGHRYLPHQINHRANLLALQQIGAQAVVSLSVCGVTDPHWELARPILATDLYFPENRLGDGTICTVFDQPGAAGRGHLIASTLSNPQLVTSLAAVCDPSPLEGIYGAVPGPRFNTRCEIRALQQAGVQFISQTCGPEAVLCNELELPYGLVGFGIDYANGVTAIPTPITVLNENLAKAKHAFDHLIKSVQIPDDGIDFANFVYRFG